MAGGRRQRGGICGLLDLIEEHRAALEYDFRTRFPGLPDGIYSVPQRMGWGEAVRAARTLRADPSSMLAASVEGWHHPVPRLESILMNHYDLTYKATGVKNPEPYPRPWPTSKKQQTRSGNAAGRTPEQVKAILRGQFGQPEAPV